jgi:hypothetical protein
LIKNPLSNKYKMVRETVEIADDDQATQKKESLEAKSHEEILEILKDIESVEIKLKDNKPPLETYDDPVFFEIGQDKHLGELDEEIHFLEVPPEPETIENLHIQEIEKQSHKKDIADKKRIDTEVLDPSNATFTLKLDEKGNLVGFNIKSQMEKDKRRRFRLLKRESTSESTEEVLGIIGKFKGLLSRLKPKGSGEEGSSKISNVIGKIKGIFSRS